MPPPPTKRARLSRPSLLSLPDEVLSSVMAALPPKPAFLLALTNTRLLQIFRSAFEEIDATTPFATKTIYTRAHINSLLRQARNLKSLKISAPLRHIPHWLPLRSLALDNSVTPLPNFDHIPTLRFLRIDSPLLDTPKKLHTVVPRLSTLELIDINSTFRALLDDIQELLGKHASDLEHLSLTISCPTGESFKDFTRVISNIRHLTNLQSLSCGMTSPECVSQGPDFEDCFSADIAHICFIMGSRPQPTGRRTKTVHVFTRYHEPVMLEAVLPMASDGDLTYSFSANSILLPLDGRLIITELASTTSMYKVPYMAFTHTDLSTFNMVDRELATSYTPSEKQLLAGIITPSLRTLRVQIPFRSETNLEPIAMNITDVMDLSQCVEQLHITREIVHFTHEQQITKLMSTWGALKRLYLTAPEYYVQDPYPELRCTKYSAWLFIISLPQFLALLSSACPQLETLLLEEMDCMGEVQNPTAMTSFIQNSLNAVEKFEAAIPGVDASTVTAQLLVWRHQYS